MLNNILRVCVLAVAAFAGFLVFRVDVPDAYACTFYCGTIVSCGTANVCGPDNQYHNDNTYWMMGQAYGDGTCDVIDSWTNYDEPHGGRCCYSDDETALINPNPPSSGCSGGTWIEGGDTWSYWNSTTCLQMYNREWICSCPQKKLCPTNQGYQGGTVPDGSCGEKSCPAIPSNPPPDTPPPPPCPPKKLCPTNQGYQGGTVPDGSCGEKSCPAIDTKGKWSEWGEWSACSLPCGRGTRTRERTCLPMGSLCGMQNKDREIQRSECNVSACDHKPKTPLLEVSQSDYCASPNQPPVFLSWTFSDQDVGDTQSAYRVQIRKTKTSADIIDTGEVASSSSTFTPLNLEYSKSYYWRVTVWDSSSLRRSTSSSFEKFTTQKKHPTADFSWSPSLPTIESQIDFHDQSAAYNRATIRSWLWSFEHGEPSSSSLQNPATTLKQLGSNNQNSVTLTVKDSNEKSCSTTKLVKSVSVPFSLPRWEEITPFSVVRDAVRVFGETVGNLLFLNGK